MNTENVMQSIRLFTRTLTSSAGSALSMAFWNTTLNACKEQKKRKALKFSLRLNPKFTNPNTQIADGSIPQVYFVIYIGSESTSPPHPPNPPSKPTFQTHLPNPPSKPTFQTHLRNHKWEYSSLFQGSGFFGFYFYIFPTSFLNSYSIWKQWLKASLWIYAPI